MLCSDYRTSDSSDVGSESSHMEGLIIPSLQSNLFLIPQYVVLLRGGWSGGGQWAEK